MIWVKMSNSPNRTKKIIMLFPHHHPGTKKKTQRTIVTVVLLRIPQTTKASIVMTMMMILHRPKHRHWPHKMKWLSQCARHPPQLLVRCQSLTSTMTTASDQTLLLHRPEPKLFPKRYIFHKLHLRGIKIIWMNYWHRYNHHRRHRNLHLIISSICGRDTYYPLWWRVVQRYRLVSIIPNISSVSSRTDQLSFALPQPIWHHHKPPMRHGSNVSHRMSYQPTELQTMIARMVPAVRRHPMILVGFSPTICNVLCYQPPWIMWQSIGSYEPTCIGNQYANWNGTIIFIPHKYNWWL